jgi:hypothetical protein
MCSSTTQSTHMHRCVFDLQFRDQIVYWETEEHSSKRPYLQMKLQCTAAYLLSAHAQSPCFICQPPPVRDVPTLPANIDASIRAAVSQSPAADGLYIPVAVHSPAEGAHNRACTHTARNAGGEWRCNGCVLLVSCRSGMTVLPCPGGSGYAPPAPAATQYWQSNRSR